MKSEDATEDQSTEEAAKRMVYPLSTQGHNVGDAERIGSALVGGALVLMGLQRRSLSGTLMALVGGALVAQGATGHSRIYQWFGLNTAGTEPPKSNGERLPGAPVPQASKPAEITPPTETVASITVGKSAAELYDLWLKPETMAQTHKNFAQVEADGDNTLHWKVPLPLDKSVEWQTQVVQSVPGERIRWVSTDDAPVKNTSEVTFKPAPGDRGTEVTLFFHFEPPMGKVGEAAAKVLGMAPAMVAGKVLRNFKALVETGEVPTLENNVSARGIGDTF